ncbi:MAG: tRNA (adenosine(37)-N6)-threonylcarbamoyltransferase complex transferase subunit TsaD [Planctomycetota bacterium]
MVRIKTNRANKTKPFAQPLPRNNRNFAAASRAGAGFVCLGIETSCDETAVSIIRNGKEILANVVLSQIDLHSVYGGVVPEIACRAHIESILPILIKALKDAPRTHPLKRDALAPVEWSGAHLELKDISAVAVTNRPGLIGALLVGVSVAKTLAWLLDKPLIPINHIEAHLYVNNLTEELIYPYIGLVVSGGHTSLFYVKSPADYRTVGRTRDDAAGESFDKVAKILGLGYPGGPIIEQIARKGNPSAIKFPRGIASEGSPARPYGRTGGLGFSFSGLKTAALYHCKGQNASARTPLKKGLNIPDICASFQEAVVDTLVQKTFQAAKIKKCSAIVLGGGVACNGRLRERFQAAAKENNIKLFLPAGRHCTDNAVMVGAMAYAKYRASAQWRRYSPKQLALDAYSTAQ